MMIVLIICLSVILCLYMYLCEESETGMFSGIKYEKRIKDLEDRIEELEKSKEE